jgi:hypothetical protein
VQETTTPHQSAQQSFLLQWLQELSRKAVITGTSGSAAIQVVQVENDINHLFA